jgi:hypothetical protein
MRRFIEANLLEVVETFTGDEAPGRRSIPCDVPALTAADRAWNIRGARALVTV